MRLRSKSFQGQKCGPSTERHSSCDCGACRHKVLILSEVNHITIHCTYRNTRAVCTCTCGTVPAWHTLLEKPRMLTTNGQLCSLPSLARPSRQSFGQSKHHSMKTHPLLCSDKYLWQVYSFKQSAGKFKEENSGLIFFRIDTCSVLYSSGVFF